MATEPKLLENPGFLRAAVKDRRAQGHRIALVPTMGALHEGHLALVNQARSHADTVIVSIFVNPAQFAPNEDFSRYPRTLAHDMELLNGLADFVYVPSNADMYPSGFSTRLNLDGPATGLETDFRPHFFSGVAIVVTKLFLQSGADVAVFGEKDYQQLKVVTQLARDLDIPIEIIPGPTVRESDGLALSSRNQYLSSAERDIAPIIFLTLGSAREAIRAGAPLDDVMLQAKTALTDAGLKVDYMAARNADTLGPFVPGRPGRILVAAWLGKTRLIDNLGF
ncbi:MAG: pantoate--beta-alanine ligase [Pseudomonadota bacterium]